MIKSKSRDMKISTLLNLDQLFSDGLCACGIQVPKLQVLFVKALGPIYEMKNLELCVC